MTITVKRESAEFDERKVRARYVQRHGAGGGHGYLWCEVGDDRRYNIREGRCDADDVPADIRAKADERRAQGIWPFWVSWPHG